MTKKTRLIILSICAVLFISITPLIIFYSLGYRYDFKKNKTIATGGIYVKATPLGSDIIIDNDADRKTGIFTTYVFVQNLLPGTHQVVIKKDGYVDYQKTLDVTENEVTKLEHVNLFQSAPIFTLLPNTAVSPFIPKTETEKYSLKNNNLYLQGISAPLIKNVLAFKQTYNLLWLASDGFLYRANQNGENVEKITQTAKEIKKKNSYQIFTFGNHIFVKENMDLLKVNPETQTLEPFASDVIDMKNSPDGQKMVYWTSRAVTIFYLEKDNDSYQHPQITPLLESPEAIKDIFWINSDYLLLVGDHALFISEIDVRHNVNSITLTINPPKDLPPVSLETAKVFFDNNENKIYLQDGKTVLVSERLIP